MWKIEQAFLESGCKVENQPDNLGMKHAEDEVFYYRFNHLRMDASVKSKFERWAKSINFTCFSPKNQSEFGAIKAVIVSTWLMSNWDSVGMIYIDFAVKKFLDRFEISIKLTEGIRKRIKK